MGIRRYALKINGVERYLFCDPEQDSLAAALRRLGLTGTKIGCGTGLCGACSVIMNGRVIRSCAMKMKQVEEYSDIITIEGVGAPGRLHPLQEAWMNLGGVQCGFCTPGFIVSAKALLDVNPAPSRAEVRQWFQKQRNVCRCTGYKPLVDSVMAAAAVLRGEIGIETLRYQGPKNGDYYGTPVRRPSALAKVCGLCDYGDDVALKMPPGTLHLALVQPKTCHHAQILKIDAAEALSMPGVVSVITARDIQGTNLLGSRINHPRAKADQATWPVLAERKIFRYGDVVAVVAADTREHARAAARAVKVALKKLPEYLNYLDAALPDAIQIHPGIPNIYMRQPLLTGEQDTRRVIEASAYTVAGSFHSTREPHMPLEPDSAQAYFDEEGKLTIACKTQDVYGTISYLSSALGVATDRIHVIENPTGASFGAAVNHHSYAIVGACALALQRPVTLTMSWEENQHFSGKRAPAYANGRLACDGQGRLTALEIDFGCDHGAYHEMSVGLANRFVRFVGFPYRIPNASGLFRLAYTNHNLATTYRGYGAPQAFTCLEALVDLLADQAGLDPFDFRLLNIARPGDLTVNGYPFREYPMPDIFARARPIYEEMKATAAAESTPAKRRAVGVACGGFSCTGGNGDFAEVCLELNPDGTFTNYNTWEDQGQGGDAGTVLVTVKALEELKITPEQVRVVLNDSRVCPNSGMAASSRCHIMVGNATIDAARQLLQAMRKADGSFRTYAEMKEAGISTKYQGRWEVAGMGLVGLNANNGQCDPSPTLMYGLFLADVEVDMATGQARCLSYVAVDDIGVVGNPISVEGQAFGGASHSIGFALSENYDDVRKHANMKGAGIPYPLDTPDDLRVYHCVTPRSCGPWGSAGCSELYQSGGHMAVINAIARASGVRIYELPATADKIKAGLDILAAGGTVQPPPRYWLGSDLYEELEEIKDHPV